MKTVLSLMLGGALLAMASCSSPEPVTIEKGKAFTFDEQEMQVNYMAYSVLTNDDEKVSLVAPEGKMYLLVETQANDGSYFLNVKEGENKLEALDYLDAKPFVGDVEIGGPNKKELYLVDAKGSYSIEIKSYSDAIASLTATGLKDESSVTIPENMRKFLADCEKGGHVQQLVGTYVEPGTDPASVISEKDQDFTTDPVMNGLKITYVNGSTFYCSSQGIVSSAEITWDGDHITSFVFAI